VKTRFSPKQETAIAYLALCGENQGDAYHAGKNAHMAIAITLQENRVLNAVQLNPRAGGSRPGTAMRAEAVRRVQAAWDSWEGC